MTFHLIDKENWKRKEQYKLYQNIIPCTFSMNVEIDISHLLGQVKNKKMKFFPVILYGITKIVNQHKEFCIGVNEDGNLGYYDNVNPSYTVLHKQEETFSNIWTEYDDKFNKFYQNYSDDMEKHGDKKDLNPKPKIANVFNVSCIPWVSFKGFNLNLQKGYDYYPPIFTIGKYHNEGDRVLLPLAIQAHHAVCDGYHVARFVNELQEWTNTFVC